MAAAGRHINPTTRILATTETTTSVRAPLACGFGGLTDNNFVLDQVRVTFRCSQLRRSGSRWLQRAGRIYRVFSNVLVTTTP